MSDSAPANSRHRWRTASIAAISILAFLSIYVLSIGPVYALAANDFIPIEVVANDQLYAPLFWVADHCEPFHDFILWYLILWMDIV